MEVWNGPWVATWWKSREPQLQSGQDTWVFVMFAHWWKIWMSSDPVVLLVFHHENNGRTQWLEVASRDWTAIRSFSGFQCMHRCVLYSKQTWYIYIHA